MKEKQILADLFDRINNYITASRDREQPVVCFNTPSELKKKIDLRIPLQGITQNKFMELVDQYLDNAVNTGNKQFFNQLYAGFNFPAFVGEIITALTNTSYHTYEAAPVATLIEEQMISLMNSFTGYTEGDGTFLSGGSNANLIAMFSARNRLLPESRFEGYDSSHKLVAFINAHAHYSFETAANVLGIGAKNMIKVKTDENGRMIPSALDLAIREAVEGGKKPFFVAATCGTTMTGAYDSLVPLAEICRKYGIWFHADGAFGGSVILSEKHRHLLDGIELTDSFTWDPHKLMNIPLICSALLVKHRGTLQFNLSDINTDYLYHDHDDVEDPGKKSIQCGRRVDAVKLWFAWKYFGLDGYRQRIDHSMDMAIYAESVVKDHPDLELMDERQSFAVCFRYVPKTRTDLNAFNLKLRETIRRSGLSLVNYGFIGEQLTLRIVTSNAELEKSDIDRFFQILLSTATSLEP